MLKKILIVLLVILFHKPIYMIGLLLLNIFYSICHALFNLIIF
jgi:hypothetical protein